jgi:hypothetical protein
MKLRRTLGRQPVTRAEPFEAQDNQARPYTVLIPIIERLYLLATSLSNSDSVRTGTPNSLALSYFEPGSVPTIT